MSRPVKIPRGEDDEWTAGANEILNMLFHYIDESPKTYEQVEDEAGLGAGTLKSWRRDRVFPQLDSFLRALHAVGYTLVTEEICPSPPSHPGYFAMRDKIAPPGYVEWPLPTPEEIAIESKFQRLNGNVSIKRVTTLSREERQGLKSEVRKLPEDEQRQKFRDAIKKHKAEKLQKLIAESAEFHEQRRKKIEESALNRTARREARLQELRANYRKKRKRNPNANSSTTRVVKRRALQRTKSVVLKEPRGT